MMPRYALEAINRWLQEAHNTDKPFGNIVLILGGDFRYRCESFQADG